METPQAWRVTADEVKARGYNLDVKNPHAEEDDHGDPASTGGLECGRGGDGAVAGAVEGDPGRGAGAMNAKELLLHHEKVTDSPGAVGRMRRFVLELAVRGKLVPQDASDEPAQHLLARMASERARKIAAGELRPSKAQESDAPDRPGEPTKPGSAPPPAKRR